MTASQIAPHVLRRGREVSVGTKLQRPYGLVLCGSIFLLTAGCFAQLRTNHHVVSEHPSKPGLMPREKGATPQSGERLIEGITRSSSPPLKPSLPASTRLLQSHIFFERNDGQADSQALYLSHGSGYSLFLTRTGATIVLPRLQKKGSVATKQRARYFKLRFDNTNPQTEVTGIEVLPGTSNYFSGSDPKFWHTRVPQFAKVRYSNLYPGIDLIFYFRDGELEYDVIASTAADPSAISFQAEGANLLLTREGDVALKVGAQEVVRLRRPYAYQPGSEAKAVPANYFLHHGKLSFTLGHYDRGRRVVIDPALIFSTFITSNCTTCLDVINDIAADNSGVYLTGQTNAASFPAPANGPSPGAGQNPLQTFIVKLDPTGSHVLYSAFLASSFSQAIALDALGSAYVSGEAFPDGSFPLTSGVFSNTVPPNFSGGAAFATKLSPDGSTILYSTLLQQPSPNPLADPQVVSPSKIAVDSTGALYIGGQATPLGLPGRTSSWMPLPVTLGAFQTTPGAAFVMKLNPNASGLAYATYIDGAVGPSPHSSVAGVAIDSLGDAFVAGSASGNTFPTTSGAYQTSSPTDSGFYTGFVMELNPSGTAPVYSTFFGTTGSSNTQVLGLALDSHGQAIIAGYSTGSLPVTPSAFCGNSTLPLKAFEGFVDKFTADGSALVYGTTFCAGNSNATSVAVDPGGAAYVVGVIDQPADFQPFLLQPIQGYPPSDPGMANVALKFDTSGALQWSTFLGTNLYSAFPNDRIAVDGTGAAYVVAYSTLPPTPNSLGPRSPNPGAGQPSDSSPGNFLLKIAPSLGAPVPIANPLQVSFASQNVGTASASMDVQVGNFGDAPVTPGVSISGDFSETNNCSVAVPGGQKCDINVVFTPTATGTRTGTLTVTFSGNIPPQTIPLIGNAGASAVTLSPISLTFGAQAIGTTSGAQQVTVTNSGTGPLILSSLQATSEFATTNTCGGQIAPGGTCTIQVTFTPSASGTQTGTLTIADNAADSPQIAALTGNVASPGPPPSIGLGVASGGTASATVTAGATATYALSIGGSGVSGTASLTCTGAPTGALCSVPATVPLDASSASTFNASVSTTSRSPVGFYRHGSSPWVWALVIFGCMTFFKTPSAKQSSRSRLRFAPLFILAVAFCSCGGGSNTSPVPTPNPNGTPTGTYTLVLTAKSGSTMQTQNLTLTVQ
jgi:hypothetical protein